MRIICLAFILVHVRAFTHHDCFQKGHDSSVCNYMKQFSKQYKHHQEFLTRYRQLKQVQHMGEGYGYTSRSDMLPHERLKNKALQKPTVEKRTSLRPMLGVPKTFDLRPKMVNPMDQGECGNCFAYAATAAIEYWYARLGSRKVAFNVDEFTECTSIHEQPNAGCDGGLMEFVFDYGQHFAVPFRTDGYKGCYGQTDSHLKVDSYEVQGMDSNENIEHHIPSLLVKYGPITVGIDTDNDYISNYVSGVFHESNCGKNIDHAVAIVGYTKHHYIVKNSWGTKWGEAGYFRLRRNVNACGLAEYVSYITGASLEHRAKKTGPYHSLHQ